MMRGANEVRVGVVVIAALILGVVAYYFLRGVGVGAQEYYLRLDGAAIVSQGNDVRLQGVKIGVIEDVTIDPDTQKPLLTLSIRKSDPPFSLYRSYRYTVKSNGFLGENYVDIQGTPQSGDVAYLANDFSQIIPARAAAGIFDVGDQTGEVIKDLRVTLGKFNTTLDRINSGVLSTDNQVKFAKALEGVTKLTNSAAQSFGPGGVKVGFGDPNTQRYLNATLANAALAAGEAGLAARDVRRLTVAAGGVLNQTGKVIGASGGVINENRGQLRRLLVNLDRTTSNAADTLESVNFLVKTSNMQGSIQKAGASIERAAKNVEDTTAAFKTNLSGEDTQKEIRTAITALRESTEALRDTARSINTMVAEPGTQGQIKSTLSTLNTTATTLAETTANLRDATSGLKNVLGDEKVQSDMKAIPAELRSTLEATSATANRINSLLGGRRRKSTTDASQAGSQSGDAKSGSRSGSLFDDLSFTYRYLPDADNSKRNFGDVRLQTELFGAPFRIGLDNIGEGTDFTLQTGRFLGENAAIRYGLYRSKLGIGADYNRGRFSLEGNLYDPNDRSYNAYAGYKLTPNFEVLLGHEKQGRVRSNAIGVRLRP
jgi:phospholipid/cholesterol/gamma-HCH transport system substrate-binding protein